MKTNIQEAVKEINYTYDGPVTQFVAISRALSLTGEYTPSTIANALDAVICEIQVNGRIYSNLVS